MTKTKSRVHHLFIDVFVTAVKKIPIRFENRIFCHSVSQTGPLIRNQKVPRHSGDYRVQKGNIDPICVSPKAVSTGPR